MKQLAKYNEANEQVVYSNSRNGRDTIVELWSNPIGQFTVRAGANSDYSYTGHLPDVSNMEEARAALRLHYLSGELFK